MLGDNDCDLVRKQRKMLALGMEYGPCVFKLQGSLVWDASLGGRKGRYKGGEGDEGRQIDREQTARETWQWRKERR